MFMLWTAKEKNISARLGQQGDLSEICNSKAKRTPAFPSESIVSFNGSDYTKTPLLSTMIKVGFCRTFRKISENKQNTDRSEPRNGQDDRTEAIFLFPAPEKTIVRLLKIGGLRLIMNMEIFILSLRFWEI